MHNIAQARAMQRKNTAPETRQHPFWALSASMCALTAGLGVGATTSLLQAHLDKPWASLVNAASPWLLPAFISGTFWRNRTAAAVAGGATVLLELAGYYATATARSHSASHSELLFWTACAVLGGPLLGLAGNIWWRPPSPVWRGVGAAMIVASFASEAVVVYWLRLHYDSSALLFAVVAGVLLLLLGVRGNQHLRLLAWSLATTSVALPAQALLDQLGHRAFG